MYNDSDSLVPSPDASLSDGDAAAAGVPTWGVLGIVYDAISFILPSKRPFCWRSWRWVQLFNCRGCTIPGGFTQINRQDGGYLPAIIQHASGRLYGRTDGGGVYSSDNRGDAWTYLSGELKTPAALMTQGIAVPQSAGSSSNLVLQAVGVSYYRPVIRGAASGNPPTAAAVGRRY